MDWFAVVGILLSVWAFLIMMYISNKESAKEMRDFHGRLCALEEKYIQMMREVLEKRK